MGTVKFPEDSGYFNDRTVVEVITEYDFPLMYTFFSKTKDLFLAYFCEQKDSDSVWLYFPTDTTRLAKLYRDAISINDFFKLTNNCYLVSLDEITGESKVLRHCTFADIPKEYIPNVSEFLKILGHNNISTTMRYAHLSSKVKKGGLLNCS